MRMIPNNIAAKAYRIWRTRGIRALTDRIFEHLRFRRRLHPRSSPLLVTTATAWKPLTFPPCPSPDVSIIVPAYNHALVTFTCLQSLCETPTAVGYEVIVIDDSSSDETPIMLQAMENIRTIRHHTNRGFIESSNEGARAARGKYLLFLNNDTVVLPNWIDELSRTFELFPDAGLVGGKLLYPDGRLQEAGAIVWNNGDAMNYGRYDDADKPEYCYLRDVDYCSGACLLIKKDLFEQLGGFHTAFKPAYCEDADLAFRIKQTGKRVLYQPLAQIVHFEGTSSGTDILTGAKQHQRINQAKLFEEWKTMLAQHGNPGENAHLERDRGMSKHVLLIDSWTPTPDQDSGSIRVMDYIRIFQKLRYQVTFCADHMTFDERYTPDLQRRGVHCLYPPYTRSLPTFLKQEGQKYDVILSCRPDVTEKYLQAFRQHAPQAVVLYETVDLHYVREEREAVIEGSKPLTEQAAVRKRQEFHIMESVDCTIVVSEQERQCILKELPDANVAVVSNAHDVHTSPYAFTERRDLCFLGGFQHAPNVDAARYLVQEVLPLVKHAIPDVKVYLIGSRVPKTVQNMASEDVIVTGYVPDLGRYLSRCKISVNPLRFGAGVKGKILSSMAYGLPCVGTTLCFEGMDLRDGEDVLIADDPSHMCEVIVALYHNEVLWSKLSHNGRAVLATRYSLAVAQRQVEELLEHLHDKGDGRTSGIRGVLHTQHTASYVGS
ncbi:MAG: glycosyltransferase [Nitrospira sp.]|nr:glycosyltransferase [Nitrospira sp.]